MKINQELYFCSECKRVSESIEDLFFVEEGSQRGFCSEQCIESFYTPLINHYENLEKELREDLDLIEKDLEKYLGDASLMSRLIQRPDEVWVLGNEMEDEVFCYIMQVEKDGDSFYLANLCLVFEGKPSFIFLVTATRSTELLKEFKIGEPIEDLENFLGQEQDPEGQLVNMQIDDESLQSLEGKKSSYLAILLEKRSPADIPIEKFPLYQDYMEETLESPDELFTRKDDEGDEILTYIKAHERDGISFFYFVICMVSPQNLGNDNQKTLLPIISFPSLDGELYHHYQQGELLSGNLKN